MSKMIQAMVIVTMENDLSNVAIFKDLERA